VNDHELLTEGLTNDYPKRSVEVREVGALCCPVDYTTCCTRAPRSVAPQAYTRPMHSEP
jgi:hypothetical protein